MRQDQSADAPQSGAPARRGRERRRGRWVPWAAVGALALGAGAWAALRPQAEEAYAGPVRAVTRGPLTISVSEGGTIEARQKVVLKCEVDERSTTITYIVPEGTWVEEGDLLVELDASVLQDELYDEEIDVLDTEARYLAAQEELEVVKNQARADLNQARLDLRFAREDVTKYIEGEYPKQLMAATNSVTLADEELKQAKDRLDWSQQLFDKGFLSGSELDRDRLSHQSAELEVELARTEVQLLEDYTHARDLAQLEADVEQAELALERVERQTKADIVQAETEVRTRERQLARQEAQLADIQQQVENCEIFAPVSGMVVYATTGRGSFRGNEEPLDVGREVRSQEELIHIPVADAKSARIKVHESVLDKISVGQEVRITADAMPGRTFAGRIAKISPLPDAQTQWLNPDLKVYETEIHVEGDRDALRTGMTCRAEVLVAEYEDALHVPVHAVVRVGDTPTVYVVEEGRLARREVEVGLDNNRMIHVLAGLEEGEVVALAPPLEETEAPTRRGEAHEGEDPLVPTMEPESGAGGGGDEDDATAFDEGPRSDESEPAGPGS